MLEKFKTRFPQAPVEFLLLLGNPWSWPMLGAVTIVTAVLLGAVTSKTPVTLTAFLHDLLDTFLRLATSPLAQILFVIGAILAFRRSVHEVKESVFKAAQKENEDRERHLAQFMNALDNSSHLVRLLAVRSLKEKERMEVERKIQFENLDIGSLRQEFSSIYADGDSHQPEHRYTNLMRGIRQNIERLDIMALSHPSVGCRLHFDPPTLVTKLNEQIREIYAIPNENRHWIDYISKFLEQLEAEWRPHFQYSTQLMTGIGKLSSEIDAELEKAKIRAEGVLCLDHPSKDLTIS